MEPLPEPEGYTSFHAMRRGVDTPSKAAARLHKEGPAIPRRSPAAQLGITISYVFLLFLFVALAACFAWMTLHTISVYRSNKARLDREQELTAALFERSCVHAESHSIPMCAAGRDTMAQNTAAVATELTARHVCEEVFICNFFLSNTVGVFGPLVVAVAAIAVIILIAGFAWKQLCLQIGWTSYVMSAHHGPVLPQHASLERMLSHMDASISLMSKEMNEDSEQFAIGNEEEDSDSQNDELEVKLEAAESARIPLPPMETTEGVSAKFEPRQEAPNAESHLHPDRGMLSLMTVFFVLVFHFAWEVSEIAGSRVITRWPVFVAGVIGFAISRFFRSRMITEVSTVRMTVVSSAIAVCWLSLCASTDEESVWISGPVVFALTEGISSAMVALLSPDNAPFRKMNPTVMPDHIPPLVRTFDCFLIGASLSVVLLMRSISERLDESMPRRLVACALMGMGVVVVIVGKAGLCHRCQFMDRASSGYGVISQNEPRRAAVFSTENGIRRLMFINVNLPAQGGKDLDWSLAFDRNQNQPQRLHVFFVLLTCWEVCFSSVIDYAREAESAAVEMVMLFILIGMGFFCSRMVRELSFHEGTGARFTASANTLCTAALTGLMMQLIVTSSWVRSLWLFMVALICTTSLAMATARVASDYLSASVAGKDNPTPDKNAADRFAWRVSLAILVGRFVYSQYRASFQANIFAPVSFVFVYVGRWIPALLVGARV